MDFNTLKTSHSNFDKLTKAFGYPPVDWLGYVIEVIENDIDDEDAEELIMIKGSLLN